MSAAETPAVPSRNPSAYTPNDHFMNRKKQRRIPGFAIRSAIERGSAETLDSGRVALTADGYTVVINSRTKTAETVYAGSP